MFTSILNLEQGLTILDGVVCCMSALGLGLIIAWFYRRLGYCSHSFTVTLALLPALVQFVIMMVNGNLGTGIAVVGAFSLVRFRSLPGSSKEILFIFFSMATGLAIGMGYVSFAAFMTIVVSMSAWLLFTLLQPNNLQLYKELKIVIPEDLDYTEVFDDILQSYCKRAELVRVKTIQLGAMLEMTYHVELKEVKQEKHMVDDIRCRNGNLNVIVAKRQAMQNEL